MARAIAVLILRDVLAFPAAEVAEILDTTTEAVKSLLARARARLDAVAPAAEDITEPTEQELRVLLDRYIAAFENADPVALELVLRDDATLEMTPSTTWFAGKATCMRYITTQALGSPGDWRMVPTSANGQQAVVAYQRGSDGAHHALGVAVLDLTPEGIAGIVVFGDPGLAAKFGLPKISPVLR